MPQAPPARWSPRGPPGSAWRCPTAAAGRTPAPHDRYPSTPSGAGLRVIAVAHQQVEHLAGVHECIVELVVIHRLLMLVPRHQVVQGLECAGELLGLGGGYRVGGNVLLVRHLAQQLGGVAERLAGLVVPVLLDLRPARRPLVEANAEVVVEALVGIVAAR